MTKGVLRHCTEMAVDRQYVDSHGQSEVAFAFCRLLGFQLLAAPQGDPPRQKLYIPQGPATPKRSRVCNTSCRVRSTGT